MKENKNQERGDQKDPNILPATEVVKNPNPRANENIEGTKETSDDQKNSTGSEITDGEDA